MPHSTNDASPPCVWQHPPPSPSAGLLGSASGASGSASGSPGRASGGSGADDTTTDSIVSLTPLPGSTTSSVTTYVPLDAYVCVGLCIVDVPPSPKSQL